MNKKPYRVGSWLALSALAGSALINPLTAQNDADLIELETFVTTGSLIPTAGDVSLAPVSVVTSADIEKSGVSSNVLEVIRKTAPQFIGSGNLGQSNANIASGSTGGGSAVSMRNTTTLVLVNGRRVAFSPISGSGGSQFVDVNQIPVGAIERIELLQDGASATYGTDATSGVVNIILKDNYEGLEVGTRFDRSDNDGNWTQRRFSAAVGATNDKTSVTVTAEWTKNDPLWQYERGFSNPSYGTATYAGVIYNEDFSRIFVLNPSIDSPPVDANQSIADLLANGTYIEVVESDLAFGIGDSGQYSFNLSDYVTLVLANERKLVTANVTHQINDQWELFGDLLYSDQDTFSQINAQPLFLDLAADHPYNPSDETLWALNRFVEFPRQYNYRTTAQRLVGGIRGDISDTIQFEAAINFNEADQDYSNDGVIESSALEDAAGYEATTGDRPVVNFFSRNNPASTIAGSRAVGTAFSKFESKLMTADFRFFGDLYDLPAGTVRFAAGGEYREEKLAGNADLFSRPPLRWTGATTIQPFKAGREIYAAFAEFNVPVLENEKLDLNLAVRHESYSDTDDPTVFKLGFRTELIEDELVFRGTWGESFVAPTLYSMFGPADQGFTPSLSLVPSSGGNAVSWGQAEFRGGANPDLEPTESESFTLGFVYTPKAIEGLSIELTYWNIEEENLVSAPPAETIAQSVELLGTESPYFDNLRFNSFDGPTVTGPGQVLAASSRNTYITARSGNFASQELDGVDLAIKYSRDFENDSSFDFSAVFTRFNSYKVQILPTDVPEETAGAATVLNGTIPRWRAYVVGVYQMADFDFTAGISYIPSMPYENAPLGTDMSSYATLDLAVGYSFDEDWGGTLDGLSVRVGVNNVTNKMPPLAPELYSNSNVDDATYDPIGRLFFVEASYKF